MQSLARMTLAEADVKVWVEFGNNEGLPAVYNKALTNIALLVLRMTPFSPNERTKIRLKVREVPGIRQIIATMTETNPTQIPMKGRAALRVFPNETNVPGIPERLPPNDAYTSLNTGRTLLISKTMIISMIKSKIEVYVNALRRLRYKRSRLS